MDLNINVLIKEVGQREALWDFSHNEHNNRILVEKLWFEVAAAVNVSVKEVRQKWKYLRDQHRREMKKITDSAMTDLPLYEPTWKYFKPLCFLNSQISQKTEPEHIEIPNTAIVKTDYWEEDEPVIFEESVQSASSSSHVQQDYEDQNRKRKRAESEANRDILMYLVELEKKKVDLLLAQNEAEKREQCDDFHFMSSILPIMRNLTDIQKLRVRNKILQILISEMNGDGSSVSPEPSRC